MKQGNRCITLLQIPDFSSLPFIVWIPQTYRWQCPVRFCLCSWKLQHRWYYQTVWFSWGNCSKQTGRVLHGAACPFPRLPAEVFRYPSGAAGLLPGLRFPLKVLLSLKLPVCGKVCLQLQACVSLPCRQSEIRIWRGAVKQEQLLTLARYRTLTAEAIVSLRAVQVSP